MAKDRCLRKSCFTDALIWESDTSFLLGHKGMKTTPIREMYGLRSCRRDVGTEIITVRRPCKAGRSPILTLVTDSSCSLRNYLMK